MTATAPRTASLALLVLYSDHPEATRDFYTALGLSFVREQHGRGPVHHAATLPDETVLEIYPASATRQASAVRLGFSVDGRKTTPELAPGRHVWKDPDGRVVEVYATPHPAHDA